MNVRRGGYPSEFPYEAQMRGPGQGPDKNPQVYRLLYKGLPPKRECLDFDSLSRILYSLPKEDFLGRC